VGNLIRMIDSHPAAVKKIASSFVYPKI